MDFERLLNNLTTEEKIALVAGTDFMFTNPVPRLGIPSLRMSDGPHGLRVQAKCGDNGVTGSEPATSFPTAATVANSWEPKNCFAIGAAIAKEAHKYGIHVVLGPGVNIKRNPTAGRNFEYFSEDPYLAGKMAAAEVQGIQSEGVAVSVKHFALNNSENYRFMGNSIADMRAVREIYLKVFEIVVREAHPASVMCAYNKINGEYCSQNKWLLTDVLRGEWGFDGTVMTDWGAMHDRVKSLLAGLDLEMPGDTAVCRKWIRDGLADDTLPMQRLNEAVKNVLTLVSDYAKVFTDDCDFNANDTLACKVAADAAVLLKNDGTLPLNADEEFFVCGDLFEKMRYQGAGSSMINPTRVTSPKTAFDEAGIRYRFARGYCENKPDVEPERIEEALQCAERYKTALVFAGLTDHAESEGCDRETMCLPENQLALITALCKAGKKVVVVLFGGAPVCLPFADDVQAVLHMYLPGQSGGRACADLLFGKTSPSGRLAETWPLEYKDVPFGDAFGKGVNEVYKESIFVGYRYYTTAKKKVRYPFGYGLSYTRFAYENMQAEEEDDAFVLSCRLKNIGNRGGAEVVQLYCSPPRGNVFKPLRELKAFSKLYLDAGESKTVLLRVKKSELGYFDVTKNKWTTEGGEYEFSFCSDAETVLLSKRLTVAGEEGAPYPAAVQSVYNGAALSAAAEDAVFEALSEQPIPPPPAKMPVTLESRFSDLKQAGRMGKILYAAVLGIANRQLRAARKMPEGTERDNKIKGALFLRRVLNSNSLLSMSMCAGKAFPYNFAQGFVHLANGSLLKGLACFCKKIKAPPLPKKKARK